MLTCNACAYGCFCMAHSDSPSHDEHISVVHSFLDSFIASLITVSSTQYSLPLYRQLRNYLSIVMYLHVLGYLCVSTHIPLDHIVI